MITKLYILIIIYLNVMKMESFIFNVVLGKMPVAVKNFCDKKVMEVLARNPIHLNGDF